jgi:PKD domain-containing protein
MNLNNASPNLCIDSEEICTIPRSVDPPYLLGGDEIGTYVSAVRIGDVVYFTDPGEAFPEVNEGVRDAVTGARSANPVATAGDFLGYYYQRADYTDEQFGSSDFERYNVGPDLAQDNADAAVRDIANLGFQTRRPTVHANFDAADATLPGVQFYPEHVESADPAVNFYGASAEAQHDGTAVGDIGWDFGDGTIGTSADSERFVHTFPGPGSYDVVATVTDANNATRTWTQRVIVDRPLKAKPAARRRTPRTVSLVVRSRGGEGTLIGARWHCAGGPVRDGLQVKCPVAAHKAKVQVLDGAGNVAKAAVSWRGAP